jgi:hypothetical protein
MFIAKILAFLAVIVSVYCGHVPGREGKCEFSNEHNAMLGNVYSCKIKNAVFNEYDKFTVTGNHASKGRKDLGVKFVEFSASNISFIPETVFKKFPNLEYLNVNGIGLKKIQPLVNSSDLKVILANNNQITKLNANVFAVSTDLETLSFRKNHIQDVDVNAFHNLGNLRELYLSDNRISSLHMNTLAPLISLEIVSLSGNQLKSVDLELFHANLQLHEVLLYDNKITAIHPQTFTNLENLFNLELHGNLCVDKDMRINGDDDFQELIKNTLGVCYEGYPVTKEESS